MPRARPLRHTDSDSLRLPVTRSQSRRRAGQGHWQALNSLRLPVTRSRPLPAELPSESGSPAGRLRRDRRQARPMTCSDHRIPPRPSPRRPGPVMVWSSKIAKLRVPMSCCAAFCSLECSRGRVRAGPGPCGTGRFRPGRGRRVTALPLAGWPPGGPSLSSGIQWASSVHCSATRTNITAACRAVTLRRLSLIDSESPAA